MTSEKRKSKHEYSSRLLKTIQFTCPPDVLLIGNGLNRLLGLLSWQDLNETLEKNMSNEISDTYKELSFPLQICALNTKSDNFYESIKKIMEKIKEDFEIKKNNEDGTINNKIISVIKRNK